MDDLTPKERYKQQKERLERKKQEEARRQSRPARIKRVLVYSTILLFVIVGGWLLIRNVDVSEEDIVARGGIHWHPTLNITINGEPQTIPANIGITGGRALAYHTHDTTNTLHVEPQGLVTKNAIRLKKFFDVWGKAFTNECIFENCNGENGAVRMFVNNEENFDFENYLMQDGDVIEIVYE